MDRAYRITSPQAAAELIIVGGFSFGPFDAAKRYALTRLPTYSVLGGGTAFPGGHRFEAVDQAEQIGAFIYVREL